MGQPLNGLALLQQYQAQDQARQLGDQQLQMAPVRQQMLMEEMALKRQAAERDTQRMGMLQRLQEGNLARQDRAQGATERYQQGRLAQMAQARRQPPRPVQMRDPVSGEITLYDPVTREPWLPKSSGAPQQAEQPAMPASAISPDTEGPLGTGPSGFFGNMANTAAGAVGIPQPFPGVEKSVQALKNLQVQTITGMQESVPGRPSNFLMEQLKTLAVDPASLAMGDERAKIRLGQTRDMLKTEVERMERDVLAKPGLYKPNEVSKTRMSHNQLKGILREYDTMLGSFEPKEEKPQWSDEKESRYQELLRKRGN